MKTEVHVWYRAGNMTFCAIEGNIESAKTRASRLRSNEGVEVYRICNFARLMH